MKNNDDETADETAFKLSSRGCLRGLALLVGTAGLGVGLSNLYHDQFWPALLVFIGLFGLMVVFAAFHGFTPGEPSELKARITGRCVMRWLAYAATAGCTITAQVCACRLHLEGPAFVCMIAAAGGLAVFALCYGVYVCQAADDRVVSTRSISQSNARQALIILASVICSGFILVGLPSGNPWMMMAGLGGAILTICLYTIANVVFVKVVDLDYDHG
jgi:hypothetical protein